MRRSFLRYVASNMAAMLGISAYILADTYFISLCAGPDGITCLNLAIPLYSLMFALGSMIGIGSATRFSLLSAGRRETASGLFVHSLLWETLFSLPFVILGLIQPSFWLRLMGGDAAIRQLGTGYIRVLLLGAPFFMTNYSFTAFIRNDGSPALAMTASLCASAFNIVFDYVFMFPLGMGMAGTGLATALSPVVSSLICCLHFRSPSCTIRWKHVRLSVRELLRSSALGVSAFVGEMSAAVTTTVYNFLLLNIAGNIGVAAFGIITNLSLIAMALFNGLAEGMQPLVSSSFGSGTPELADRYRRMALRIALGMELFLVLSAWIFTEPLTAVFNSAGDAQLAAYSFDALRLYFLGFPAAGFNVVMTAFFAAVGRTRPAFTASLLRGFLAIVLFAVLMAKLWGLNGIWLSFLAAEALTSAVILILNGKHDYR